MTLLTKVLGGCCACLFYFATLSLSGQRIFLVGKLSFKRIA